MRMDTLQPQDVPDAPAPNGSASVSSECIVVSPPLASPRIASRLAGPEAGGPLAAPIIAQGAYRSTQYVPNFDAKQAFKQLKPLKECDVQILDATNTERASHELITADAGVHVVEIAMLQLQYKIEKGMAQTDQQKICICNNLGCAYALLGRYSDAEGMLEYAVHSVEPLSKPSPEPLSEALKIVQGNLRIVTSLLQATSMATRSPSHMVPQHGDRKGPPIPMAPPSPILYDVGAAQPVYSSGEGGAMGMGGPLRSPCWLDHISGTHVI